MTGVQTCALPISGRIDRLERELGRRVAIEVKELENFYPAEDYHQEYLYKNPGGYCHINPSLFREAAEARDPSVSQDAVTEHADS